LKEKGMDLLTIFTDLAISNQHLITRADLELLWGRESSDLENGKDEEEEEEEDGRRGVDAMIGEDQDGLTFREFFDIHARREGNLHTDSVPSFLRGWVEEMRTRRRRIKSGVS